MGQKKLPDIHCKLRVLNYVKENGNVSKSCRYFGISRETYYEWKRAYVAKGERYLLIASHPVTWTVGWPVAGLNGRCRYV